jgi:NADH:ubiquinone oxidoreductase subunit 5 (subunit L)/multisubunit Na+/H+ antiporter MnhA subunit
MYETRKRREEWPIHIVSGIGPSNVDLILDGLTVVMLVVVTAIQSLDEQANKLSGVKMWTA